MRVFLGGKNKKGRKDSERNQEIFFCLFTVLKANISMCGNKCCKTNRNGDCPSIWDKVWQQSAFPDTLCGVVVATGFNIIRRRVVSIGGSVFNSHRRQHWRTSRSVGRWSGGQSDGGAMWTPPHWSPSASREERHGFRCEEEEAGRERWEGCAAAAGVTLPLRARCC